MCASMAARSRGHVRARVLVCARAYIEIIARAHAHEMTRLREALQFSTGIDCARESRNEAALEEGTFSYSLHFC